MDKSTKEKVKKAWNELDFRKVVDELIEGADVWKNGSIDSYLVWDKEKEELTIIRESEGTYSPSFIYLFRMPGYQKPDVDEDLLYWDLIERDIDALLEEEGR